MEHSYKFFENKDCKYYACHNMQNINCLFCYCPLSHLEHCPGTYKYIEVQGKKIKSCTDCTFPHEADNYDVIIKILSK